MIELILWIVGAAATGISICLAVRRHIKYKAFKHNLEKWK